MAKSRPSRSSRKADDADVSYEIATPFKNTNTTIHLLTNDDDSVEVLIGNIPRPYYYENNHNTDDREKLDQHAIAQWILEESASELSGWEYQFSSSKSRSRNYYLSDVYFECDREEVNDAVLAAKRFLTKFEEKVVRQKQRIGKEPTHSPLQDIQ